MEKLETTCQVRADLKRGALHEAFLRSDALRKAVAEKFLLSEQAAPEDKPGSDGDRGAVSPERKIDLYDGVYEVEQGGKRHRYVIENLMVTSETVYVRAVAETDVCSTIIRDAAAILTEHTGQLADLDTDVEEWAYATESRVRLCFLIERLFSKEFRDFVFGSLATALKGTEDSEVVIHPFDIDMMVRLFSKHVPTARGNFRITHPQFGDHDAREYQVFSMLRSAEHYLLLEELEKRIPADENGTSTSGGN
jgi:hypothetical protein